MRIWHQSYTDLSSLPTYANRIRTHADAVMAPEEVVDVHGLGVGAPALTARNAPGERLLDLEICAAAVEAEERGYDAMVLGCVYDPALRECRSLVDIPVLGFAEEGMLAASAWGRRIGLISLDAEEANAAGELIAGYGLASRIACSISLDPEITESEIEASSEREEERIIGAFSGACERCEKLGADVIIPAEGVLSECLVHHRVDSFASLPVIDVNGVLWLQAVCFSRMRTAVNLFVGRGAYYRKPDAGQRLRFQRSSAEHARRPQHR